MISFLFHYRSKVSVVGNYRSQELILTKSYARSYNFLFENLDKNRKILTFLSKILYGNLSQIF
jgi:hypothetical protein